jgi:DNA-binding transcriptional LysR family regulator
MFNPHHLRTLCAVVATGSFAGAAETLGYTASAVSQQMSALERAAGLILFERGPRSAHPTAAARHLAGRADGLLDQFDSLRRDAQALASGARGVIHLGTFPTAGASIVPTALARLVHRQPHIEILLDEGEPDELLTPLLAGAIDAALVYRYELAPRSWPRELAAVTLMDDSLVLLIGRGHPRASGERVTVEDLADDAWIASRERTPGARCLTRLCADAGFDPQVAFRSNDYDVVRGLVRAGLGVAIVPLLAHVPDAGIVSYPVERPDAHRQIMVLHRPENTNPLLPGVVDGLRRAAGATGSRRSGHRRTGG